nr:transcription factor bye1 [Quercus suber]
MAGKQICTLDRGRSGRLRVFTTDRGTRPAYAHSTTDVLTRITDEPRRSGRATKGQHKNASPSPAPAPKAAKSSKPKITKKSTEREAEPEPEPEAEEDDGENDRIRCICGNEDAKDKRAFIGCDACTVWQHNVCMGMPIEEEDVPDHYFCEECRPEEHPETMLALGRGENIWETRNRIWQNERKSKGRKSRGGREAKPGWLKKDIEPQQVATEVQPAEVIESQEIGTKRKLEETKEKDEEEEDVSKRPARQDKRRKSSSAPLKEEPDTDTALVEIDQLPADRQKPARALSKAIAEDVTRRVASGFRIPDGHTAKSLGDHHAARIEYALHINHSGQPAYKQQFLALNANFKSNKMLIERLLNDSLTADDLAIMDSKDMASEQLQRERADLKKELDRQATAIVEEGPRIRRTHKGDEIIENEAHVASDVTLNAQPVRERASIAEDGEASGSLADGGAASGSPLQSNPPPAVNTRGPAGADVRRTSSQQFDTNNIWAKTAQSPGVQQAGPRPVSGPLLRQSSVSDATAQADGATHDPDVDRMLEDNDEAYSPADYTGDDSIIWRGKLAQGDGEPTVNARFVAGRVSAVPWSTLLPDKLSIDGRLAIQKAEEYLCGLQWSTNSDVSVLALTPYDDADTFNTLFEYFESRKRYAVVSPKHLPNRIKDLYIVPVDIGGSLPEHIGKLDLCKIKTPIEERVLLATFVMARGFEAMQGTPQTSTPVHPSSTNGHHLPQHIRGGGPGPAGSPIASQTPVFSSTNNGATGGPTFSPSPFAPSQIPQPSDGYPQIQPQPTASPLAAQILGNLYTCPTAVQVLAAEPNIDREKLENLRKILEQQPEARTNIEALAKQLMSGA